MNVNRVLEKNSKIVYIRVKSNIFGGISMEEKLTKQVTIRFTESQFKKIQEVAEKKQRREADLIRLLVMSAIEQIEKI